MSVPDDGPVDRLTPSEAGSKATLPDGRTVLVRTIRPTDRALLADGMRRLSPASRYRRFHAAVESLSDDQLRYLTDVDHHDHSAVVAVTATRPPEGVGVARYIRTPDAPDSAEIAITVLDAFQGLGVGKLLLATLVPRARAAGIERFTCRVLADNDVVLRWFTSRDARLRRDPAGLVHVELTIDDLERATDVGDRGGAWSGDDGFDQWLAEPDRR